MHFIFNYLEHHDNYFTLEGQTQVIDIIIIYNVNITTLYLQKHYDLVLC